MTTTLSAYKHLEITGKLVQHKAGKTSLVLDMITPVKDFEQIHVDVSYL